MNSNHYIPVTAPFKNVIHSIWQVEGFTAFHEEHILPKGIVEIIFNFSDGIPILANVGDKQFHLSNCFINGFNTAPVQLRLPEQQKFFGVQFHPLAVKKIFRIPACEFSDTLVDLTLLDTSFHSLWHQLAEQNSFDGRVAVFSGWMERKLPDWQAQEKLVNNFLSSVDQHDQSVTALARSLCYSPRQLSRKMAEATGMNTEEMLLYKKYLHAVHLIHHSDLSLTKIAYQSHFSDQSHFIKSFKSYTNLTPGEYKRNKGYLKGHIYENVR
ncbi:MAG: helix-turn-helix domain-containing protein [Chitinophagaceae bacterium]